MSEQKINKVIETYLEIRNDLDTKSKEFEAYKRDAKEKMQRIEIWLKEQSDKVGVDGFNTSVGTAYKITKDYVRVGDWDLAIEFIKKTGNFQMLEKRLAKNSTKEVMEQLGEVPPGVDYQQEIVMQIRKR